MATRAVATVIRARQASSFQPQLVLELLEIASADQRRRRSGDYLGQLVSSNWISKMAPGPPGTSAMAAAAVSSPQKFQGELGVKQLPWLAMRRRGSEGHTPPAPRANRRTRFMQIARDVANGR